MRTHAALLRGINVGGHRSVKMEQLRMLLIDLGLTAPETLLQSGNAVFGSGRTNAELEDLLTDGAERRFGFTIDFFVRNLAELNALIASNPFVAEARADPSHLLVVFLRQPPDSAKIAEVQAAIKGPERIAPSSNHIFVVYPDGIGASTVAKTPGWNKLFSAGTARNWNTVTKLAGMLS